MRILQRTILAVFSLANAAFCVVQGVMPLSTVLNKADAVVVATVTSSVIKDHRWNATLTVRRSLKGDLAVGSELQVAKSLSVSLLVPEGDESRNNPLLGTTGIWFLTRSDSDWSFLSWISGDPGLNDIYISSAAEDLPAAYAYDAGIDLKRKLLLEIEASALNPKTAGMISRQWNSLVLDDFGQELLEPVYDAMVASSEIATRSLGLMNEIRLGTPAAVEAVASIDLKAIDSGSQDKLANAVCRYRNSDAAGVAALGSLSGTQYPVQMQTCAVYALREIHSKESLPFLEKFLDSDSPRFRYDAVIGIAQFALKFPMATIESKPTVMANFKPDAKLPETMRQNYPDMDLFAKNEQQYISYWKTWLTSQELK